VARTGRRPGNQDTREAILAAARQAFAERGFDQASIRHIANTAAVDPALVHHYFGTKDQLFIDAMQVPFDPSKIVPHILAAGLDGVGERLIRTLLMIWDSAAGGPAAALVRSAVSNEAMARMLRDFLVTRILRRVARELELDPAEAPLRANLVATQIAGLIMVRYILKFEPLASSPPEVVVALIGPTIQRYLTAPLPANATTPPVPDRRRVAPAAPATTPQRREPGSERSGRRAPA
jgi:AcrR family transcriptional regulator